MRLLLLGALLAALTACAQAPVAPADLGPWPAFHPPEVALGGG
jgi:hypothetical protein